MRYLEVFAGIGGFGCGIKKVIPNAICVGAVEWDKNAAKTFENNHGVKCLEDIKLLDISTLPEHDILMAGFPCQPFSACGKWGRTATRTIDISKEDRQNLFTYLIDILETHKPKYFLFENVKGIKSVKNKDGTSYYDVVMTALKETGYSIFSEVLDAADYGSAQQRKRVFFAGFRDHSKKFEFPKK